MMVRRLKLWKEPSRATSGARRTLYYTFPADVQVIPKGAAGLSTGRRGC